MKKVLILLIIVLVAFRSGSAQSCDTLFNLRSNLDTATILAADTGAGAGYLSGNNIYGDIAKAEVFAVADSGYYITSATFNFGVVTINPGDTNTTVTIIAWDNTGLSLTGNNAPGNVIDSVQVTLGQIAKAVTAHKGLLVYFSGTTSISTDSIYVGVILPSTAGDTLALLTNSAPPGPDGNGWEYVQNPNGSGPAWGSYNNDWQFTGGSLGNYISATLCSTPSGGTPASSFGISGNDSSGCSPVLISFSDSTTPSPDSWTWSFGDGSYSNEQNPTHAYTDGGAYTVSESVTYTAGSVVQVLVSATAAIQVSSSPVIVATVTPVDTTGTGSAYITVTGGTGHHFTTWTSSSGSVNGDTLSGVSPDTYVVAVVDQNGCSATDSVVISSPSGVISLDGDHQVKIYPIPATNVLNLQWSKKTDAEVSIIDMNGNLIKTMSANGDIKTIIDMHSLPAGAYLLRITDKAGKQQQSIPFSKY